jgi:hypothetical protein
MELGTMTPPDRTTPWASVVVSLCPRSVPLTGARSVAPMRNGRSFGLTMAPISGPSPLIVRLAPMGLNVSVMPPPSESCIVTARNPAPITTWLLARP